MKITIVGWYGTETIGDRAILIGIILLLQECFGDNTYFLGSLYPFFTERTLNEDLPLIKSITKRECNIHLFNSKNKEQLQKMIDQSDLVVMGGGPLMHINEMYMIHYAFSYANRRQCKTALLGCGVGPIFSKEYKRLMIKIMEFSDCIILRDSVSKAYAINIFQEFNIKPSKEMYVACDASIKAISEYLKMSKDINKKNYIAVNLRKFPMEYVKNNINGVKNVNNLLKIFINELAQKYTNTEIRLVPNHYFVIGDDDRVFMNEIFFESSCKNIVVQNKPLTTVETFEVYQNAEFCVGMRFHSIIFQTLLNGNNYILDYTEPNKGKISGFLNEFDKDNFYDERYVNVQNTKEKEAIDFKINNLKNHAKFQCINEIDTYYYIKRLFI